MNPPRIGYLLCDDLFFASRIEGTARALGLELATCRKPADLVRRAAERAPACVIVDVNQEGLAIEDLIGALKKAGSPFIVGYGSHVQAEVLRQASTAGCDLVLPRSRFAAELDKSLPAWFGGQEDSKPGQ